MHYKLMALLALLLGGSLWSAAGMAQEVPALKGVSPEEKARVEKLIEGAKAEGVFSYIDAVIQPKSSDEMAAAFRAHYGLPATFKINYTLSATGALVTRVEQELSAKKITNDIVGIASPSWVYERVAAGDVLEYDSPEYKNYTTVFENGLGLKGFFAFNGGYIFVPMWNSETLDFKGKGFKDVIGAVPEGRLSIGDSSKSVTYIATQVGLVKALGREYFAAISKMKPPLVLRSETIVARLVSGEDLMAFTGMPTRAYQANLKGAKIKFILNPEEGVVLMPQSMFILKGAPHPNAAKLWVDFMLSEEGQNLIVKHEALISGRNGFKSPIPEYAPPIDSLKLIKIDWKNTPSKDLIKEREEWVKLFNP